MIDGHARLIRTRRTPARTHARKKCRFKDILYIIQRYLVILIDYISDQAIGHKCLRHNKINIRDRWAHKIDTHTHARTHAHKKCKFKDIYIILQRYLVILIDYMIKQSSTSVSQ